METSPSTNASARIMATFLIVAGVAHFANPTFFDDIVPPWLPPSERFWTYASGVAELAVGIGLLSQRTRSRAAWAAFLLFLAVYPANLYMAWDWRDKAVTDQLVAFGRLPLQFVMFWWAIKLAKASALPVASDVLGFQERK
ncbi:MAG: DoxX family membrane protein [Actinobacteria bacterium]|jgi:uncharacterized membrane protein|uniref:Unannotated protein n=1 Tax=freshwater metagenome TaxID=449393 RepID=A0A6J6KJW8_9ZZZZ|nr:hypothetical protein [Actinomycetota bacterium]MSZ34252.1 DoxX family membrane protein [Actinomycetota bacterium]